MATTEDRPVTFTKTVAGRVVALMTDADITPHKMARLTDIPLSTLRRSLSGNRPFTVDELQRVAAAVNTTVTAVVSLAEQAA